MEKLPMTVDGFERLKQELSHLKKVERQAVIKAIADARALGDLSENAEYHAAREKQGFIEGRITELESKIARAEVIDISKLTGTTVKFGASVTLYDEDTEQETTYQIMGIDEADISKGLLSISSPLAKALIGKDIGDRVEVRTPNGSKGYEILKVIFK
ncbi:transcription elongation factor GreA [Candidatus Nucleicultrix amoebiphila]|jgi:transcription elongation factor GreA|uniref:Transcription elongation factor GreA n=1 Tax=Candidatus Nucleicultrix amoebiphila FS5 TaxID=1414854 RepID=A0A1W6N4P2_9PROT|nr:transcription elongation factor GreA [Candidatus Nucleicultrix amoebiphila]ARN84738.1 transcription elongation factor GreA [Candidatus Nucleicultrix amoebiphila FS5]